MHVGFKHKTAFTCSDNYGNEQMCIFGPPDFPRL